MAERRYRPFWPDALALAYFSAYFAWMAVRTSGTAHSALVADLFFFPLGLILGWASWRNSRIAGLDTRTRRAWLLFAASSIMLWLSGTLWVQLPRFGVEPPRWIELLELSQHLLALIAYITFPNGPRSRGGARQIADIGLIVVAGFVLAFDFVLRVSGESPGSSGYGMALLRASVDWADFVVVTLGFARKRDAEIRVVFGLLILAQLSYLFANYFYSGITASYHSGDTVDVLWFAAWIMRWAAVRAAWHMYRLRGSPASSTMSAAAADFRSSVLSYLILAGAFLLLIAEMFAGESRSAEVMAIAASLMAALLLFRQFAELRLNRQLFEAQLAQEARFRSLVQNSSDMVLVVGGGGVITYVSPSAGRIFGDRSPIQQGAAMTDLVAPEDRAAFAAILDGSQREPRSLQTRIRNESGDWRDLEVRWTDLTSDPAVGGVVLNCRDVTERNELERRLQHAQKIDAVGHLAGGLAHDFNNVLMVIRGYTELLRGDLPANASAQADLANMEQAVDRASTVTRKLLAFSRRQAVQPTVLDLNAVLADLQPIFRQLLADGVQVRIESAHDLWPVKADQGQLEQVVVNLATNARDAMPHGGSLLIATTNRTIEAQAPAGPRPGDYVVLQVADGGTGMDEKVRARIFEPFFSTKAKDRGVGLGLAMVHDIVNRAGGHISVDSAVGHGTTFTILLPRTTEARAGNIERVAPSAAPAEALTILLVDDEPSVRAIARRLLERAGYIVIEATAGQEAMEIARRAEIHLDLLVTDMVMPGLTGRELISQFAAARPGVPIIAITGFAGEADQHGGDEVGLSGLVTKPFSADALLRAVANACASRDCPEPVTDYAEKG